MPGFPVGKRTKEPAVFVTACREVAASTIIGRTLLAKRCNTFGKIGAVAHTVAMRLLFGFACEAGSGKSGGYMLLNRLYGNG